MTWGRHNWPRKDEVFRLYRERNGAYFLVEPGSIQGGNYSAIANVLAGKGPSLGSCMISPQFIHEKGCKRVQWSELPEEWKAAFLPWFADDLTPEKVRGFWTIGNQPKTED